MKYNRMLAGLLAAALLFGCTAPASAAIRLGPMKPTSVVRAETETPREGNHPKYMDGNENGLFLPETGLTRAEFTLILEEHVDKPPQTIPDFVGSALWAWYERAVGALAGHSVVRAEPAALLRPDEPITRAECAQMLANYLPESKISFVFADVETDDPLYGAVCTAVAGGIFACSSDRMFRPEEPLSRAEACVVFNRLLHREPDTETISRSPAVRFFPDVPTTHWAYCEIAEAATSHDWEAATETGETWTEVTAEPVPLPDGLHLIDGWLFCVQNGQFIRSAAADGFTFTADGRSTTGNIALDEQLAKIIRTQTDDSMSSRQKLRAVYNYVRDNYSYIKRPLVAKGTAGWEPGYAEAFLADGCGNCFGYAATFCLLARGLGVDAHTVVGNLGKMRQPHGWVEIVSDGTTYVYDAELEMNYRANNFFGTTYGAARFQYYK